MPLSDDDQREDNAFEEQRLRDNFNFYFRKWLADAVQTLALNGVPITFDNDKLDGKPPHAPRQ